MNKLIGIFVIISFLSVPYAIARPCLERAHADLEAVGLREGDIIFISSNSAQADMLEEATRSIWTHVGVVMKHNGRWGVVEASAQVTWTPLQNFVNKSRGAQVSHKRVDTQKCIEERSEQAEVICNVDPNIGLLRESLLPLMGKPYDIHFQPDDERIYCSELTQKAYERAFGIELGKVETFGEMLQIPEGQTWRDLPADSHVYKAIMHRFDGGRSFDPDTPVWSPVSQYNSAVLEDVYECRESVQPERNGARTHE